MSLFPSSTLSRRAASAALLALLALGLGIPGARAAPGDGFVRKEGAGLTLSGRPYRYGGLNIEWLGLEFYGPQAPRPPAWPTEFEVKDALATAAEMGVRVVRTQTLGDTVGCPACIEPELGSFNEAALDELDGVLVEAARRHIRLIIPLTGDCSVCILKGFPLKTGINQYLTWFSRTRQIDFFQDPEIRAAFERHIFALLEHRNHLTGVRLKDDPTILAWENCNICTVNLQVGGPKLAEHLSPEQILAMRTWIEEVGRYVKSLDRRHLYFDNSGLFRFDPSAVHMKTPDIMGAEYYPHWSAAVNFPISVQTFRDDARAITAAGKVYAPSEVGWDRTNWPTEADFQGLLTALASDPKIAGDSFWALQAHAPDHGWQAIPVDDTSPAALTAGESGEWWALYYTGRPTLVTTKADMAERAQMLRTHYFLMAGAPVPAHDLTPAPVARIEGDRLFWRGAAGAATYSVERSTGRGGAWETLCDRCLTDEMDGWSDPSPPAGAAAYRVTGYNLEGRRGATSQPTP